MTKKLNDLEVKVKLSNLMIMNDKALESILRSIIFADDIKVDWQKVLKTMYTQMPELVEREKPKQNNGYSRFHMDA